jgi:pilus assembly protein CpaE
MPTDTPQLDHLIHAVFSVCATPDVVTAATEACLEIPNSEFVGEFHDYFSPDRRPQLSPSLRAAAACVAIVDCDRDPELALSTMERLRTMALKNLSIVAFCTKTDASYLLRAMRAGCNEFLNKPAETKDLRDALQRFQNSHLIDTGKTENAGRVISFYGAKGGVGTTTLAVHLANNLVRRHRKRTLLIDHKHELGHVALYLGMKNSQYHFDELVRNANRLDHDLLTGFVARHSSGLEVLTSPDTCAVDHKSSPEEIDQVLNFLRNQYDYVLIDSSFNYKDIVGSILRGSDGVCLVSTSDVAALRDLARHIEYLNLDEETSRKLRILINRTTSDDAVDAHQIEAVVHYPVWASFPNSHSDLINAINAGEPLSVQDRSQFAQQINKWTDKFLSAKPVNGAQPADSKKRFSLFGAKRAQTA